MRAKCSVISRLEKGIINHKYSGKIATSASNDQGSLKCLALVSKRIDPNNLPSYLASIAKNHEALMMGQGISNMKTTYVQKGVGRIRHTFQMLWEDIKVCVYSH